MGELRWSFSSMLAWRKEKVDTSLSFILTIFSTHSLSSKNAMKMSPTLLSSSQQKLHKSCFLQKLRCQKPWLDQARLSSLVAWYINKLLPQLVYVTVAEYLNDMFSCLEESLTFLSTNVILRRSQNKTKKQLIFTNNNFEVSWAKFSSQFVILAN